MLQCMGNLSLIISGATFRLGCVKEGDLLGAYDICVRDRVRVWGESGSDSKQGRTGWACGGW